MNKQIRKDKKNISPKEQWHRRHDDFESFDRITLEVVPRYKASGMSGDEWRTGIEAKFWFKGEVVHEASYDNIKFALLMIESQLAYSSNSRVPTVTTR